jgi:predicted metal-dependent HD superfamily phosphohydrolase
MGTSTENKNRTFESIRLHVCEKLKGLSEQLTYHNLEHTLDVMKQCERIAKAEGIQDQHRIFLLKVAAMYHDTGFLVTYSNHEEAGCNIFLEDSISKEFTEEEKAFVTRLIMATKLPQTPIDIYECIICDADLDYLGRPDFFTIGDGLRKEFLHYGVVKTNEDWELLQIKFLSSHYYHTQTSKKEREGEKKKYLATLH